MGDMGVGSWLRHFSSLVEPHRFEGRPRRLGGGRIGRVLWPAGCGCRYGSAAGTERQADGKYRDVSQRKLLEFLNRSRIHLPSDEAGRKTVTPRVPKARRRCVSNSQRQHERRGRRVRRRVRDRPRGRLSTDFVRLRLRLRLRKGGWERSAKAAQLGHFRFEGSELEGGVPRASTGFFDRDVAGDYRGLRLVAIRRRELLMACWQARLDVRTTTIPNGP